MSEPRVIISGGGTGGHIFPALAIAGEIRRRFPDSEILFVGATGRMEMEKVPAAGFRITGLPVMGFPRKPGIYTLKFFVRLFRSMIMARRIIREFNPDLAIGVGGYASGPLLRAATAKKIPALIQEQNSYAGITNKLLGKKVQSICVAYDGMERFFPKDKIIITGNPVRQNLLNITASKEEALAHFDIPSGKKVVLITGGSLGARSINNAILKNLALLRDSDVHFIWQTGSFYYEEMVAKTRDNMPENLHIHKFLNNMEMAYMAADAVISRAGAGTISELCLVGKPTILVPSPNVSEDHQTRNAMALESKQAAILLKDNNIEHELIGETIRLIADPERMARLADNIKKLALPDATSRIVDEAMRILRK
jgi:UDP-N-acetylglucosamine--N-acetylmuramyl-(pentapeptide) pyrophosphoryl-undecaprenol N-acetylglucosamine transferase